MKSKKETATIYSCEFETPLGKLTATAENGAITGLWFIGQKYYPAHTHAWIKNSDYHVFQDLRSWLENYFAGSQNLPDLKLNPSGTTFQKKVWKILLEIRHGHTTTYGKIAKKVAGLEGLTSMSAQAVGGAVGRNPISILIPCHRVVGANKSLTGYAGGIEKKKALLQLENICLT